MDAALEQDIGIKKRQRLEDLGYASDSDEDDHDWKVREGEIDEEDAEGEEPERENTLDEAREAMEDESDGSDESDKEGPKMEAFNTREDEEENDYDEQGGFYQRRDDEQHQDQWLEDVDAKSIQRAKRAEEQRNMNTTAAAEHKAVDYSVLLRDLAQELELGETPLEALGRLNKRKDSSGKSSINTITDCCSGLMDRTNTYDMVREEISREYTKLTGLQIKRKRNEEEWEFKWSSETGEEIQGPFSTKEMEEWIRYDYFDSNVLVRNPGCLDFQPIYSVF